MRGNQRQFMDNQFFKPADPAEDEASNEGRDYKGTPSYDLQNPCANCGNAFNDHHNGHCPKD